LLGYSRKNLKHPPNFAVHTKKSQHPVENFWATPLGPVARYATRVALGYTLGYTKQSASELLDMYGVFCLKSKKALSS